MTITYLSASGIKSFKECRKQFFYKYVSDVEPPEEEEVEAFEVGNAVHESIENVLQEHGLVEDQKELLELLREEERSLDYNYSSSSSGQVQTCLETASRYISGTVVDINSVEDEWWMDKDGISFKGYADLVADIEIGGELHENAIIDWKTGKKNDMWKEKVQGGMYLEMFYQQFGSYPDAIEFVYLNEEEKNSHKRVVDGEVRWNEHENKYWTEIEGYINDIQRADAMDEWEANPDSASSCHFCDYKYACSDYLGGEKLKKRHIEMEI